MLIDNDWPEETLNLANRQLVSMLSSSVHVYLNIQVTRSREEARNQISIKIEKYHGYQE